jgi:hypothetical protein
MDNIVQIKSLMEDLYKESISFCVIRSKYDK